MEVLRYGTMVMLVAVSKIRLRGSVEELLKGFFRMIDGELLITELNKDDRNIDGTCVRDNLTMN